MLQVIRDKAQSWIAWVIVGLIIIPFALFGLNQYVGGGEEPLAASVDDSKITDRELQQAYYRQRERLTQMFGDKLPPNMFSEEVLKKQLLQQLIEDRLVMQNGLALDMVVGDQLLAQIVHSIGAFQQDGQFSRDIYSQVMRAQGMAPAGFEEMLRRDLMLEQYRRGLEGSEFATLAEQHHLLQLQQQQRRAGYLTIPVTRFKDAFDLSEADVEAYYRDNSSRYMRPEQASIEYIELKQSTLNQNIEISDEELRERYDAQKLNYITPEERRASHILFLVDEDSEATAKEKAHQALKRLNAGEDFSALAKELSDDPGSATQGGNLGYFGREVMDPAFEAGSYAMQIGEVSSPIRSEYGFHIIRLDDIRGGETKSFDMVKQDLKLEIQNERSEQLFYDQAELLASLSYEHPDTLQTAADELGLSIKKSTLFTRQGGVGITQDPKVTGATFSEDVLQRGNNSAVLELARDHLLVLRLLEHRPEGVLPLDEVRGAIVSTLKQQRATKMATDMAATLLLRIESGESVSELAQSESLEWHQPELLMREHKGIDSTLLKELFRMPHPAAEGSVMRQITKLPNGDSAVVELFAVIEPVKSDGGDSVDQQRKVESSFADATMDGVIQHLRANASITIKQ